VLVTGRAGFIGRHLVAALVAGGDEVTVLDNLCRGERAAVEESVSRFMLGDVRDPAVVADAARGAAVIYHLAAQSNVLGAVSDIDYSFTTNVVGTYNVLTMARDLGVERVVFTSSREVYGEVDHVPVNEDQVLNPKNAYGASKVAGEVYCRAFQTTYGLDVAVLRLSNVYGPGDRDRVIPIWMERARAG
jgi:UDP-glucose 4-epimerase